MNATADAVVVGAGVIGSAIALELARSGLAVIVVDKAGGPGHGSTSASSAVVRYHYSTREGVAAAWESRHYWANWSDHVGSTDPAGLASIQRSGMVVIDVPLMPRPRMARLFGEVGVPFEEWEPGVLQKRVPGVDVGKYWPPKPVDDEAFFADATEQVGAIYTPDAGFVDDPQLATHNLAQAAERLGSRFIFNKAVIDVDTRGSRVHGVTLSDGSRLSTPIVVNAAGPWSSAFNQLAGVGEEFTIRVRPMRQEVHQVEAPPGFFGGDGIGPSFADLDLGVYIRPTAGGFLLVGGTEPDCDPLEWLEDPDGSEPRATLPRFHSQVLRAARRLPGLRVPNRASGIAGVYDVAEDWTPIYDRTDVRGFYVAMGTSGNQFKNAPIVGMFMSSIIEATESGRNVDVDPISHACRFTGNSIDLSVYSRKRRINGSSSGTVMG